VVENKPSNCRLDNLAWGTPQENEADKIRHGTKQAGDVHYARTRPERLARGDSHGSRTRPQSTLRGSKHPAAKLTESQVIEIRASSGTLAAVARRYEVSEHAVRNIKRGVTWRHVI